VATCRHIVATLADREPAAAPLAAFDNGTKFGISIFYLFLNETKVQAPDKSGFLKKIHKRNSFYFRKAKRGGQVITRTGQQSCRGNLDAEAGSHPTASTTTQSCAIGEFLAACEIRKISITVRRGRWSFGHPPQLLLSSLQSELPATLAVGSWVLRR
jgi:hypothetical protein